MDQPGNWYCRIVSYERILFYVVVILNIIPALGLPVFPSLDGPTHLYNANVIQELLVGSSELLSQYYCFNDWVVPNWGGHFIMTALLFVFPATISSSIFIGLCLILLPASFRYCVKTINPNAILATYLIFPFTYTFILCMGFYNFYIGLIVLFTTIGVLVRYQRSPFNLRLLLLMVLLAFSCYICHLFVFITLGMVSLCFCSLDLIKSFRKKESTKNTFKKTLLLSIAFIIPLLLLIVYFRHVSGVTTNKIYLLKDELLNWITSCRSMICYVKSDETRYTTFAFFVFMFLFSIAVYIRSDQLQKTLSRKKVTFYSFLGAFRFQDTFLLMVLVFIYLYFKLPDSDSLAGFVSVRMNLMIFLFLILWVSEFDYPKWILLLCYSVLLFSQYTLLTLHYKDFKNLNKEIDEIMILEKEIKKNTVILPVNYSPFTWLSGHNSNYLGINKPVIILENHECANPYFPLKWNPTNPMGLTSNLSLNDALNPAFHKALRCVDYVFVQGKSLFPDSLKAEVQKHFLLKQETKNFLLFEKK